MANGFRKIEPLRNITNRSLKENKKPTLTNEEMVVYKSQQAYDRREICMVHRYSKKVFEYFVSLDKPYVYSSGTISWEARSELVDWIIGIHHRLELSNETLFLSIALIDRFLMARDIPPSKLQLVGITALAIACKFEEVVCPTLQNLIILAENRMSEEDIKKAEKYMLHTLNYDILFSCPLNFLRKCSKSNNYERKSRNIAKYLLELSTLFESLNSYSSSIKAATAMYLARKITQQDQCKNLFALYSEHTNEDIKDCFNSYIDVITSPIPYTNIISKYDTQKYSFAPSYVKEHALNNFC
ncbi:G2/mitotic-specific cyclin cdc13 [Nosema granulosis]|uniref:G2/mitotic-specific cyclin cdc13 n=1 Tax=Nosema granulosis TaxID=83296 RepID=A0A9P6KZX6_9MICR|nr:G2/mitotic-specific cyclin cdc13 [Nosema granulosis]